MRVLAFVALVFIGLGSAEATRVSFEQATEQQLICERLEVVSATGERLRLDFRSVVSGNIRKNPHGRSLANDTDQFHVWLKLDSEATYEFGRITAKNIGKAIEFRLNDRVVSSPIVRSSILGGAMIIVTESEQNANAVLAAAILECEQV